MYSRVYLLLDILEDKVSYALQALQNAQRVAAVDRLEGHPNVMVVIEAPDRQQLADIMMPVLESVDKTAKDVHILINQNEAMPQTTSIQNIYREYMVPGVACRN